MIAAGDWYPFRNVHEIDSPALLIYPDRVKENIRRMLAIAGSAAKLRPHVKTHKLAEIIALHLQFGVRKFKCATIAEAEMAANTGAEEVLLAYPPVGPRAQRLIRLIKSFPQTTFAALLDDAGTARTLSAEARAAGVKIEVFLDIDCGQHRTGITPGSEAVGLYRLIATLPGLIPVGLHVYDGHIHDCDPETRANRCNAAYAPVESLKKELEEAGLPVPKIVAGGTPTFPMHAQRKGVECTPGTCVLWDYGYATNFPDMHFLEAALLLTRVISKPRPNHICVDLGHKAVASENPHPRVQFLSLPDARAIAHSEEHFVLETTQNLQIGDCLYGVPWHICPTVALHSEAVVVENGMATTRWQIAARSRQLSI